MAWAVTSPGRDEREVLHEMLTDLPPTGPYTFVADKGYRSKDLDTELNNSGVVLLRPARPQRGPTVPAPVSCVLCDRGSIPCSTPSRTSSASSATLGAPPTESSHASPSECWP